MQNKTKICPYCKAEIDKNVEHCPNCKKAQPVSKASCLTAIIVVFVMCVLPFKSVIFPTKNKTTTEPTQQIIAEETTAEATEQPTEPETIPDTTEGSTEEVTEAITEIETEVTTEPETEAETEPPTEPKPLIGKDIDTIGTFSYNGNVRNDTTGDFRYAILAEYGVNVAEYAVSYYDKYMSGSDKEIHAVINLLDRTTTKITQAIDPNELFLTVYSYVDGEEHDAVLMFSGTPLKYYTVNKETGEITEE